MSFAFLAGLPRSGSSLLAGLLNQHEKIYVSPTSGVIDMLAWVRNNWLANDAFRAVGAASLTPRIRDALRNFLQGFYTPEFVSNRTVIDKNRAWPAYIEMMEDILGRRVTVICTVRDILDVFQSFENLRAKNPLTYPHGVGQDYIANQSIYGRFDLLMGEAGTIGLSAFRLVDAIHRGLGSRLLIVPYDKLMADPVGTAVNIMLSLGVKPKLVSLHELPPDEHRNDVEVWGAKLHSTGANFDQSLAQRSSGAVSKLPTDLVEMVNKRYPGVCKVARQRDIVYGDNLKDV